MRPWVLSVCVLAGFGGGGGDSAAPGAGAPAQVTRPVTQSDAEIAALLYSDRQRTPDGFRLDAAPTGYEQVTTLHLAGCTDDWNEALEWSETAAEDAPSYANLVETRTDPRFFEFNRVTNSPVYTLVRMRVYRCAFFDPVADTLNARPLDAATVGAFAEYQWQFTPYNNFGNVVLERATRESAEAIEHTLDLATLTRAADGAGCDRVDVIAWRWRVRLPTGAVEIETEQLWQFGARFRDGASELCSG
ncbi:MAG: hypothetical protein CMLOHMNK_00783 [Steroidobacteraceae bacterium]|nr:hypothetical protein [Steroidobacteraceae bacterium]